MCCEVPLRLCVKEGLEIFLIPHYIFECFGQRRLQSSGFVLRKQLLKLSDVFKSHFCAEVN